MKKLILIVLILVLNTAALYPGFLFSFSPKSREVNKQLDTAKELISKERYPLAIATLSKLIGQLKDQQKQSLKRYFPTSFQTFKAESLNFQGQSGADLESVIFSRHYEDAGDAATIDVNLVFLDPSIREYLNLIKNPQLMDHMENTRVIKLKNGISAIEKNAEQEGYFEVSAVLDETAMVNIMMNKVDKADTRKAFIDALNLEGLKTYLTR